MNDSHRCNARTQSRWQLGLVMTVATFLVNTCHTQHGAMADAPCPSMTVPTANPMCFRSPTSQRCGQTQKGPEFDSGYGNVVVSTLYYWWGLYVDDTQNYKSDILPAAQGCQCNPNYNTMSFAFQSSWYDNERNTPVQIFPTGIVNTITDKNTQYTTVCSFCTMPGYSISMTGPNVGRSVNGPANDKMLCAPTLAGQEQQWGCVNDGACTRQDKTTCTRDELDMCKCKQECCQEFTDTCMAGTCNRLHDASCHCAAHVHHSDAGKPKCDACDPGWGPPVDKVDIQSNRNHSPCSAMQCDRGCGNPLPSSREALADKKTGLYSTYADAVANTATGVNQASKFGVCTSANQCRCAQNHRLDVSGNRPQLYMSDATNPMYGFVSGTPPCSRKEIESEDTGGECEIGWRSTFVNVGGNTTTRQNMQSNGDCAVPDCHATAEQRTESDNDNIDTGCNKAFGVCVYNAHTNTNYCVCKLPTMDPENNCLTCKTGVDKRRIWQGENCDQPVCVNTLNQNTCEKGVCKGNSTVDESSWCDCDRSKFYGDRCQYKICDTVCNGVCDTDTGKCGFVEEHTVRNATTGQPLFCKNGWDVPSPYSDPTYFIYGEWVGPTLVQRKVINPVDRSTIYMVEDMQHTKMVDSRGQARYYVGKIADLDVQKWSEYGVADGKYLLKQCPAGALTIC